MRSGGTRGGFSDSHQSQGLPRQGEMMESFAYFKSPSLLWTDSYRTRRKVPCNSFLEASWCDSIRNIPHRAQMAITRAWWGEERQEKALLLGLEGGKKNLCLHSPPHSPIRCIRIAACVERLYPPLPSLPNLKGMILLEGKERERRDGEPQAPRSALCRPSAGMQGWHGLGESWGSHSAVLKLWHTRSTLFS